MNCFLFGITSKMDRKSKPSKRRAKEPPIANSSMKKTKTIGKRDLEGTIDLLQTNVEENAAALDTPLLRAVLDAADHAYYDCETTPIFPDPVYDLLRDLYLDRLEPEAREAYTAEVSIKDGQDATKMPKGPLPIYMSSLEKLKNDPKALARWVKTYPGPYWLRAKLDGCSMLYFRHPADKSYHLMTRHDKTIGGVADALLKYMSFPPLHPGELVRGELIMKASDFEEHFAKKPRHGKNPKSTKDADLHSSVRNSVGGAMGAVISEERKKSSSSSVDPGFVSKMRFVAYEFMPSSDPKTALPFETQVAKLRRRGFEVVDHFKVDALSEKVLETAFYNWRGLGDDPPAQKCAYDMDGVVFSNDQGHPRPVDRNPKFARAFKMDVADQMADTRVVAVHWNPSAFGLLKPQVEVEPVRISEATFTFCSGKHAKYIQEAGIGPGAEITLIRSNDVIPDIKVVKKKAEPSFPTTPYTWISEVEIAETEVSDKRKIRALYRFFDKLGVENLGESSVAKLFEEGYTTVKAWVAMEVEDIGGKIPGVGKRLAEKWVHNLRTALGATTLDQLINGAGLCGRGIGSRRLAWVFGEILKRHGDPLAFFTVDAKDLKEMCLKIEGVGDKVIDQVIGGRKEAHEWWLSQLNEEYRDVIVDNTLAKFEDLAAPKETTETQTCADLVVLMTGFHDKTYEKAIVDRGGTLAKSFTKKVNLLLVKDLAMKPNGKTRKAQENGIKIMGAVDFKATYMI